MRTSAVILLAIAGAVALPSAGQAKQVSKVEICGASGCATLPRDRAHLDAFMNGGVPADPPPRAAAWYSIRYTISPGDGEDIKPFTFRNAYVPGANRLRERDEGGAFAWFEPSRAFVREVRAVMRRVTAYPASRLRGLDANALEPRVIEVAPPPGRPPAARATGDASTPWGWIALAASAAAVLLAALAARGRRRRAPRGRMAT